MQAETTIGLLDRYLLMGQVSVQDVADCLARHSAMPYLRHLELSGLAEGLPTDASEATRRLIYLRLLFADNMDADSVLSAQLHCMCSIYHSLQAYIHNEISRRELELEIIGATKSNGAGPELRQLLFALRYILAEDPQEVSRPDVVNACFRTMRRIEALWSAILD